MHFSMDERVERFRRYYRRENERPLLGFFVESEYPILRYRAARTLPEGRALRVDDFEPEGYLADYDRLFGAHEAVGGDFIWAGSAFWGIPWLEAALGCEIFADHQTGSLYSEPAAAFAEKKRIAPFDVDNPWVVLGQAFVRTLADHAGGRYPLGTPRMRGVADLIAALYGNEQFIFAFMEDAEAITTMAKELTEFYIGFAKSQLEYIPLFHGGVGSFYYNMWAPAGAIWHQEDAAALLSPDLYEQYILPCDLRIAEAFGGCFMHMHPTGYYPYRPLLDSAMTVLELHIDQGGPSAEELYDVHREILSHKPLLIWGQIPEKDLDWIFSKLPHEGLAVLNALDNPGEGEAIWNRYVGA